MNIIHYVNMIHKSPDRRMRKRAARREEMLDAALKLLETEGLAALTVQRLASELDQSVGALYRYFPGKAGLLVALQERAIASLEAELVAELARADAGLRAVPIQRQPADLVRVLAALTPFIEGHARSPARHRLIDELMSAPEPLLSQVELRAVNARLTPLLTRVVECLADAITSRALQPGDSELRARLRWAAFHGIDHLRKRDRAEPVLLRSPALVLGMVRSLLRGFGALDKHLEVALSFHLAGRDAGSR